MNKKCVIIIKIVLFFISLIISYHIGYNLGYDKGAIDMLNTFPIEDITELMECPQLLNACMNVVERII